MILRLKKILFNKPLIISLWFGLSLFAVVKGVHIHNGTVFTDHNNYIIYKHNFLNLIHQHSLFGPQPAYYFDLNHYGPVFGLVIAPFALLPDGPGVILWVMFLALSLYFAIIKLPLTDAQKTVILLLNINSMMGSAGSIQVNPLIIAFVLFSFTFIKKQQDFWAALMIVLGTVIKLYGIVGLAFFVFSDNKVKLILSLIFWSAILFVLPMLLSSPEYIMQTYKDWYPDLVAKNAANAVSNRAYVCVMGMISRIFKIDHFPTLVVLIPGMVLFALSLIRIKYWRNLQYQLLLIASTLIFSIIFSSSSEPPTYIIAFIGVCIWFVNLNRNINKLEVSLMVFALAVTGFGASDLMPRFLRSNYILPYSLMALPCLAIWLKIVYEMLFRKFDHDHDITSVTAAINEHSS